MLVIQPTDPHPLRALRWARGLAMYALAVQASVSPTIIGAVERHGYIPGPEVRQRLAQAMNVDEADIFP
jgi:transcriptional regulator with XRE-family HTH domain